MMKDTSSETDRNKCHEYVDLVSASDLPSLLWLLRRLISSSLNEQYLKDKKSR